MHHGILMFAADYAIRPDELAIEAEARGFESVFFPEHTHIPVSRRSPYPGGGELPKEYSHTHDLFVTLAAAAAVTKKIKVGAGICLIIERDPIVTAKEVASVDVLSNGRLIFGLGAGYLKQEFDALGARFDDRGARTDEYIDVLRALWTQEKPSFAGRTVKFSGIDAQPRPVQRPHPPIVVGGMSASALKRALLRGNGWYGFARDLTAAKSDLAGIATARAQVQRPAALGALEINITPPRSVDEAAARAYADLGVDRLILLLPGRGEEEALRFVEQTEPLVRKLA